LAIQLLNVLAIELKHARVPVWTPPALLIDKCVLKRLGDAEVDAGHVGKRVRRGGVMVHTRMHVEHAVLPIDRFKVDSKGHHGRLRIFGVHRVDAVLSTPTLPILSIRRSSSLDCSGPCFEPFSLVHSVRSTRGLHLERHPLGECRGRRRRLLATLRFGADAKRECRHRADAPSLFGKCHHDRGRRGRGLLPLLLRARLRLRTHPPRKCRRRAAGPSLLCERHDRGRRGLGMLPVRPVRLWPLLSSLGCVLSVAHTIELCCCIRAPGKPVQRLLVVTSYPRGRILLLRHALLLLQHLKRSPSLIVAGTTPCDPMLRGVVLTFLELACNRVSVSCCRGGLEVCPLRPHVVAVGRTTLLGRGDRSSVPCFNKLLLLLPPPLPRRDLRGSARDCTTKAHRITWQTVGERVTRGGCRCASTKPIARRQRF